MKLCRLALFAELRRSSLKRDEISKKVMSKGRRFQDVLDHANLNLSNVFGMKLVELKSRAEREQARAADDNIPTKGEDEEQTQKKKKPNTTSKAYILRSSLDPQLIALASEPEPDILALELQDLEEDMHNGGGRGSAVQVER